MTVSILGVFREGRMSPETWEDIGLKVSPVFNRTMCPIGFDTKLLSDKSSLAEAIDDSARANGVSEDLLEQLAPAASGDAILVITVAGRPNTHTDAGAPLSSPTSTPQAQSRGMRGPGRGGALPPPTGGWGRTGTDRNAFEMSASLYSVHDHRTVALVNMGYSGTSGAEALQKFAAKLRDSLPGLPCVGWNMNAGIDEKKIQALGSE
jgi:hypothetical protein